ncbi:Deleted in lung and esophageal cancer protein 1 [Sciurus carolinensis]|uniref:Deleted in lung and esophageal cancer protein 1 n=1 Tax=Sciurus carolinensis TaxID=30640 RepID=A0AA41N458_SCICA|nr:Deleted in lung and esophageal cancer protein 1 [Sciurus carolinensis]
METKKEKERRSSESETYEYERVTWAPNPILALSGIPESIKNSSLQSSHAYSESFRYGFATRPRRGWSLALPPHPEPQLLRLRPSSLCTQDISHLLTSVFRNLYSAEVIGEEVSASLIKARGSDDARHEEFVDQLQQIRELHKQRLDEVKMLERHIIQAQARALAETERSMNQAGVHVLEALKLPPVKTVFRWCVDSELLRKHHLISPEDYYNDTLPFCSAPKGTSIAECSKLRFRCEKNFTPKGAQGKKLAVPFREKLAAFGDEFDYTMDSLEGDSIPKGKERTKDTVKKARPPKNKNWMKHLHVPQRELERLLLARMESRNHFLRNPRFFPPNTPHGGKSLIFPPVKPALMGDPPSPELEQSYMDAPVFLAKPSIGFFTDYEIGPVYEMVISLQNTTSASRYLRVLPPSTPHFALGLGMFPGKGGMVAPGMTCQYTIQFIPDCLGDFDDFILVETQSPNTLLIPLQARRPPPVLTLSPVLDCGYCLIGGVKITRFICKNVGFSTGKFCIMPKKSWPPPSFRAVATTGFVEQPPFGVMPSVFELAPGFAVLVEVLFLPVSLEKAEQTFIIVCDNCQVKELVITGTGQLIALDLIYISGEKSQPDPGELTDLTAQHFIRFKPENLRSTARKQLIIRNATHVELAFHWQIMKPNLQPLMPGETYSLDSINYHPDRETAFSIMPEKGVLSPHTDQEFVLSFSPSKLRSFHSVLQMVLEEVPEPLNSEVRNLEDYMYSVDDVIVLEIEVKGSAEPFQVLLEPYALIIPGENYIGINVKKDFKMWNNSKSPISYTWGKISHCHIIEVEPCTGVIEPNEVGDFVLNFTGGVPGPASQDLLCEIRDSPSPVVLHIEAAFKVLQMGAGQQVGPRDGAGVGHRANNRQLSNRPLRVSQGPALVISVSALQFGLLRLGQKVTNCIQIRNVSQLSAVWHMRESPICLEERHEEASPFDIEPSSGYLHPLGECQVMVTLEALRCQRLQTVLELEVEKGTWSYLPVYAEVQEPHVYLQSSQVEFSNLYVGVPTESTITLINGTLLFTRFHWGKLLGHQADSCTATVSPKRGLLGPGEECELNLELTTHTKEELTDLALPCHVSGMKKPLALGISGKPQGLHVTITVSVKGSDISTKRWPGDLEELHLDFGSMVPLRTQVNGQLILTNCSPVQTSFTLNFEYFGSPKNSLTTNTSLPDLPPALLKTSRIREHLAKQEQLDFMESMLSPGKGAAFFPHTSKGTLGAYQKLSINITGCANMWGEYWDNLICQVGDLPPAVIPVHMAVVGCPISTRQATSYRADKFQKEPIIRFGTQVSGGATIMRKLRLNNSSPCDIRLDWVTYVPEEKEDKLVDLLVFYGPPFPLWDQAGNEITYPETPESSSLPWSPSPSSVSDSSHAATSLVEAHSSASNRAAEQIISVILQGHEGVPSNLPYYVSPKQVVSESRWTYLWGFALTSQQAQGSAKATVSMQVVPAGGSSTICISFTPMMLSPHIQQKVKCTGYALGFMSLDNEQCLLLGRLSVELDSSGNVEFWCQASDLIPEQPCSGVLSELLTTRHLKLINTTEIPHYFQLLVSRPFFVSQGQASRGHRAGSGQEQEYGETASEVMPLELRPQENMLVDVSFSLSLELLSYQRLPLDQMLPGVDIQQSTSGEKEMVFTQDLLLVVPLRATVAVPELQLSSSWVDFGTCFVNQQAAREIYLMNLSGCRSYWAVLMGQQSATEEAKEFGVSPSSGFLEARPTNAPPTSITLQVFFTPRSNELYESTMVVEGMMGEKSCALRLRGQGSYDETFMEPKQL